MPMPSANANLHHKVSALVLLLLLVPHPSTPLPAASSAASASASTWRWTYSVPENTPHPHVVANITADFLRAHAAASASASASTRLVSSHSSSSSGLPQPQPTFELVRSRGVGGGGWFELASVPSAAAAGATAGASASVLRVAQYASIDREDGDVCAPRGAASSSACVVRLLLAVGPPDSIYARLINVHINITDVNDNAPRVFEEQLLVRFSESDPVGTTRTIEGAATDADAGRNAELVWKKLDESVERERQASSGSGSGAASGDYIGLNESSGGALRLVLLRPVDRELVRSLRVVLEVGDRGEPALRTTATATVEVRDVNDCRPTFLNAVNGNRNGSAPQVLVFNVSETFPVHQTFAHVEATDCDVDERNRALSYTIKEPNSRVEVYESGELSLREPLDYESVSEFTFTLLAADRGEPALTATASVLVRVLNENDAAPTITPTHCRDTIVVKENGPAGQTLPCVYLVSDDDAGQFGVVRCELRGSLGADGRTPVTEFFELVQSGEQPVHTFRIRTRTSLDREALALPGAETVPVPSGGVASPIDLTLACRDNPNASIDFHETRHVVRVLVEDENDCTPTLHEPLSFRLPENEPIGSHIGGLRAHDCDAGVNSEVVFELVNSSYAGAITLDSSTGVIRSGATFDRETVREYVLWVRVRDRAVNGSRSSAARVTVHVDDRNEEPAFTCAKREPSPSAKCGVLPDGRMSYEFEVPETPSDTAPYAHRASTRAIGRVTAVDRDAGADGQVVYSLGRVLAFKRLRENVHGSGEAFSNSMEATDGETLRTQVFTLDPNTGELSTAAASTPLDYEQYAGYSVEVSAADRGSPALLATAVVRIRVIDVNEAPVFSERDRDRIIELKERLEPGAQFATVHATDPDAPSSAGGEGQLEYRITDMPTSSARDPFGPFVGIEQNTGVLVLERSLRRADLTNGDRKPHQMRIEARDRSHNPKSAHVTVYVRVYESALPPHDSSVDAQRDSRWPQFGPGARLGAGSETNGPLGRMPPDRINSDGDEREQEAGGAGTMTGLLTAALLLLMCLMVVLAVVLLVLFMRARRTPITTNKPNNDAEAPEEKEPALVPMTSTMNGKYAHRSSSQLSRTPCKQATDSIQVTRNVSGADGCQEASCMSESYARTYCPESLPDAGEEEEEAERSLPDPERLLVHRPPPLLRDTNDNEREEDKCSDCNEAPATQSNVSTPSKLENERCRSHSKSPPTQPLVVRQPPIAQEVGATCARGSNRHCPRQKTEMWLQTRDTRTTESCVPVTTSMFPASGPSGAMIPGAHPLSAFIVAGGAHVRPTPVPQPNGGPLRLQMPVPLPVPLPATPGIPFQGHYQTLMQPTAGGLSPFPMQMQLPTPNGTLFQPILAAGGAFPGAPLQPFNPLSIQRPMNANWLQVNAMQSRALEWQREVPRTQANTLVTTRAVPMDPAGSRPQGDRDRCLSRCRKDASTWL